MGELKRKVKEASARRRIGDGRHGRWQIRAFRLGVGSWHADANWKEQERENAAAARRHDVAAERRAELVLRQSAFQAYAVARFTDQQEVKAAFPFLMYLSVGDQNVRDEHAELDGKILPVDDPFWLTHCPPWDFGCRCLVESISAEDAAELGVGG